MTEQQEQMVRTYFGDRLAMLDVARDRALINPPTPEARWLELDAGVLANRQEALACHPLVGESQ